MNDLDPDRFRNIAQRKDLLDFESIRTLERINKNEGPSQHNRKLIYMIAAGEMETYLKLCDVVKVMGFKTRYDEMISIVKDRLEESRRPGEDLDPRTVFIDRYSIPAASASRINYVQAGTGVAENIEALRDTTQYIYNQDLLTPPSSDGNEESDIEEASSETLAETDVTVFVDEEFDKSMKQDSDDDGVQEIILTTLEDIGFMEENIVFDEVRPFKRRTYSVAKKKILIRIVIDIAIVKVEGRESIRNAIINRLKRLTQSRGKVVVAFSRNYKSIEVFLLVPGRCAIALHYTAIVFPGILAGLGVLEWNLVGSLDFFDLRVRPEVPSLDNTGIQPVRRLFSELFSKGLTDTELPNLDLAQPLLKSLVEKHEHDNEFIDFLGKFILNELLSSVDIEQPEPVKVTAVRADPPVPMPTKEETTAAAASAGLAVDPSSPTATSPLPLGQQLAPLSPPMKSRTAGARRGPGGGEAAGPAAPVAAAALHTYSEMPSSNMARLGALTQRKKKELAASQDRPEFLTTPERGKDTPLHHAAKQGNIDICKSLLEAGADKDIQNSSGNTPLHYAVWYGRADVFHTLLEAGAKIDIQNSAGDTPLHCATKQCNIDICKTLLGAGAEKDIQNMDGDTPLHCAVKQCHIPICETLLDVGAEKDIQNWDGDTPLHCAVEQCNIHICKALLEAGADKDIQNSGKDTPLHKAVKQGNIYIFKSLLEAGADKDIQNSSGNTPLLYAVMNGRNNFFHTLFEAGDKDIQNSAGDTPLHCATKQCNVDICKTLLGAGAEKDIQNMDGDTPLHCAVKQCHIAICETLLDVGAEKDIQNWDGDTPLHYAVEQCNIHICKALLDVGAEKDIRNSAGDAPLHCAVKQCNIAICENLLDVGAEKDIQNMDGDTPLHKAVMRGSLDVCQALLAAGADCNIRNEDGETPLDKARNNGHRSVEELLKKVTSESAESPGRDQIKAEIE
ncbi:poly [ADP-ribose] polymerase tankyrase-1-like isoform X2 [Sycon ciliatum]|uniref:poly [ADP-ribose] polymerase tankyrase-1-like isoform X2 n=1 Tax=Sycon ciliatum TaxID=27933 RepID=UPI0031F66AD9